MRRPASFRPSSLRLLLGSVIGPGVLVAAALLMAGPPPAVEAGPDTGKPAKAAGKEEALVELGRRLFFDPAVSASGRVSCASCHDPDHGFSDPRQHSQDDFDVTKRHSQPILDTAHNPNAHWDGEFATVEDLVKARLSSTPLTGGYGGSGPRTRLSRGFLGHVAKRAAKDADSPAEEKARSALETLQTAMRGTKARRGFVTRSALVMNPEQQVPNRLKESGRYHEAVQAAFGDKHLSLDQIAGALAAYCKSIKSTESPFDRYQAGDKSALSASAKRGLALFEGKGKCASCHTTSGENPKLTDYTFHNTGVSWHDLMNGHISGAGMGGMLFLNGMPEARELMKKQVREQVLKDGKKGAQMMQFLADPGHKGEHGRGGVEPRRFKTPTLRDVAKRGPFMHSGTFKSLADVVRYYAKGCSEDPGQDERLQGFKASERDIRDLVAFLESLSGDERPGLARSAWQERPRRTLLRFVDAEEKPLTNLPVALIPDGDVLPHDAERGELRVATDKDGRLRYESPSMTHMRMALPGDIEPIGGCFVPDTCAAATVKLPVRGRMKLELTLPKNMVVPSTLQITPRLGHVGQQKIQVQGPDGESHVLSLDLGAILIGQLPPVVVFERVSAKEQDGKRVAVYEGWVRSDVAEKRVHVIWPSDDEEVAKKARERLHFVYEPDTVAKLSFD